MKKCFVNFLVMLTGIVMLTSCASIIHGPSQSVSFSSQPAGAKIVIDGKDYGPTPKSIDLKRKGRLAGEQSGKTEYLVKIEMAGYAPYELRIKRTMDGWFLGNILIGGIIGIIIDASNGAMYVLTPSQVTGQLGQLSSATINQEEDKICVAVTLHVDPSWEKIGTMEKVK